MYRDSIGAVMKRLDPFLDTFEAVARHGFGFYQDKYPTEVRLEHTLRCKANCIYDHMAEEALRRFGGATGVKAIELRGLRLWMFDTHTVVRWKKMDEAGKSANVQTKQARAFDRMEDLPGLPPKPTRITVGYLLNPTGTEVERVQVAKPNGKHVDWCAAILPADSRSAGERKWEDVTRQSRWA